MWLVMALKSQGCALRGPVGGVLSALPHCRRLNGPQAKARPTLVLFISAGLPGATSPARAPREQAHLRSRQAPGQPKTDDQAIARREDPPLADLWDSPAASCRTPKRLQLWS